MLKDSSKNTISIVIPCYRSAKTIEKIISDIVHLFMERENEYEIILINDNSPDNVWDKIVMLAHNYNNIIGINLSRNFGQHSALMAGYSKVSGDIVVSLDDDGQTPPSEMFSLIDKLEEGYDVVYARYKKKMHNALRNLGSTINGIMEQVLLKKPKGIETTSYYAARRFIIDEILRYHNAYPFISGLIFRTTENIGNVFIDHKKRYEGKSGYSVKKLLSLWLDGFTSFSVKPLRIASVLGTCLAFFGFIYILYLVIKKVLNPDMMLGYTSTMAVIIFIGGVIMMMLGLIGEYIGRIYISLNNAPQYVIKEIYCDDTNTGRNKGIEKV
jgi:undecaprenyl-phosphate 4-deoxy-4-formamido-L-arabinose transferase